MQKWASRLEIHAWMNSTSRFRFRLTKSTNLHPSRLVDLPYESDENLSRSNSTFALCSRHNKRLARTQTNEGTMEADYVVFERSRRSLSSPPPDTCRSLKHPRIQKLRTHRVTNGVVASKEGQIVLFVDFEVISCQKEKKKRKKPVQATKVSGRYIRAILNVLFIFDVTQHTASHHPYKVAAEWRKSDRARRKRDRIAFAIVTSFPRGISEIKSRREETTGRELACRKVWTKWKAITIESHVETTSLYRRISY